MGRFDRFQPPGPADEPYIHPVSEDLWTKMENAGVPEETIKALIDRLDNVFIDIEHTIFEAKNPDGMPEYD